MIVGVLVGVLVGFTLAALIAAMLLRAAARIVASESIEFNEAFKTMLLVYIASFAAGLVFGFMAEYLGLSDPVVQGISQVLGFLIQSFLISARHELSLGKGFLISLVMTLIVIVIVVILFAILIFGLGVSL